MFQQMSNIFGTGLNVGQSNRSMGSAQSRVPGAYVPLVGNAPAASRSTREEQGIAIRPGLTPPQPPVMPPSGGKGGGAVQQPSNGEGGLDKFFGRPVAATQPAVMPSSGGKGGGAVQQPQYQAPMQGQYANLAPQGQFNVNQAAAGGLQQAMQATQQGMGFQPSTMRAIGYNPAQASSYINQYQNPYESQVVQSVLTDLGGAQQKSLNQLGAEATQARAFGGSRHGIAEAETRKSYAQQAADAAAQMRQQGFNTALGAAQTQAAAQTAANQFGATAGMDVQRQNFANQLAALGARQGAASQLGGLANQAFQTGQTIQQQQSQQGLLQQGLQQALIDAARGQYAGYTGAPQAALQAPLAALQMTPNQSTTTNSQQPGLFNYLQLAAGLPF